MKTVKKIAIGVATVLGLGLAVGAVYAQQRGNDAWTNVGTKF